MVAMKKWLDDLRGKKRYNRYQEREDRGRRVQMQVFSILGVASTLVYLIWVFQQLNLSLWWISIPFLLSEVAGLFIFLSFCVISWYPRYHRPTGLPLQENFNVDVFITTCGEPYQIVRETLKAAAAIDYPQKRIYLLDDAARPELEKLAADVGAGYFAREGRTDAKAGNLNHALTQTDGDLILTLDADQVPVTDILKKTVGYFNLRYIGFVQSKQSFKLPDGDPFANADTIFYDVMQPGKDSDNAAFSCGSGVVYRRKALNNVGGFSTWNLVEDLHTSILLHAKGWKSIYHNYPLTRGTAPTDIWAVYKQRTQWAMDSLRILFWDNPFKRKGLSFRQKFQYAHIGWVYLFAGFAMPLFYLVPILSLYAGKVVIVSEFWLYMLYRMPSLILTACAYKAATAPTPNYSRAINTWLGYFPCFIYGAIKALGNRTRKPAYHVNGKTWRPIAGLSRLTAILPQSLLVVLSLVGIPYGFIRQTGNLDLLLISSLWALMTVNKLYPICLAPFSIKATQVGGIEPGDLTDKRQLIDRAA